MYPSRFEYARPTTLAETIQLLQAGGGEAKLLAGGHSLLPLMKLRLAEPARLIDVSRLKGDLAYVRRQNGELALGALSTHRMLEKSDELRQVAPIFAETAELIGDLQVRNRGTLGGSLAHADPTADWPAVMLALGAQIVAQGPGGQRVIPADTFFVDLLTTALRSDEVLVEVRVPVGGVGTGAAYRKFEQPASGYALVGVAAYVRLAGDAIAEARVGVTGTSTRAYRARGVEAALVGGPATIDAIKTAAARAVDGVDVSGDIFAAPDYRAHLTRVFTVRALEGAIARARR